MVNEIKTCGRDRDHATSHLAGWLMRLRPARVCDLGKGLFTMPVPF